MPRTITIDGPAASGKTTIGQNLARRLDYLFLDTGCMYRAVTLAALQGGVDVYDEPAVVALTRRLDLRLEATAGRENAFGNYVIFLNGRDVTYELHTPAVDAQVSQVSLYAGVREQLVARQRHIGRQGRVVMVGRDIGTVVMPDADLKLYIVASAEERARRRWQDRREQGGTESYDVILADVVRRDTIDSGRTLAPLRAAADAVLIDTTNRTVDQILDEVLRQVPGWPPTPEESTGRSAPVGG